MQFTSDTGDFLVGFDREPYSDSFTLHVWKRVEGDPGSYSLEPRGDGTFGWVHRAELEECPPMLRLPGRIAYHLIDAIQAGDQDVSRVHKIVGAALAEAVFAWSQGDGKAPLVPDFYKVRQDEWIKGWEAGYLSGQKDAERFRLLREAGV